MPDTPDRIDYDKRDDLDDIVLNDVETFRMERMGAGQFWIRCYRKDKPDVVFNLSSPRKIVGSHYFDE